jgi:hypothetical protein
LGNVKVQIVAFASTATIQSQTPSSVWMTVDQAKAFLDVLNHTSPSGNTNYDDAILKAMDAFDNAGAQTSGGTPAQSVSYFLSDGNPNPPSSSLDAAAETNWTSFLTANHVDSFALGIGTDVSVTPGGPNNDALDPIAYNGQVPVDRDSSAVTDLSQLAATLAATAQSTLTGNIATDGGSSFGADGGYVKTITYGDSTFTFTGSGNVTRTSGSVPYVVGNGNVLVMTAVNGILTLNMLTGDYTFAVNTGVGTVPPEVLGYALHDGDGDEAGNSLARLSFVMTISSWRMAEASRLPMTVPSSSTANG